MEFSKKPGDFYKVFGPFLDNKCITLVSSDGCMMREQRNVADHFVSYFATMVKDIDDPKLLTLTLD